MSRWIPNEVFHFSIRRLLVLTTAFALVLACRPSIHSATWVNAATTIYLLFVVSWCIMISYTVVLKMRAKRHELSDRLQCELQQAKQNKSESNDSPSP